MSPTPNETLINNWRLLGEGEAFFFRGVSTGKLPTLIQVELIEISGLKEEEKEEEETWIHEGLKVGQTQSREVWGKWEGGAGGGYDKTTLHIVSNC